MTKVDASFQELTHGDNSHIYLLFGLSFRLVLRAPERFMRTAPHGDCNKA